MKNLSSTPYRFLSALLLLLLFTSVEQQLSAQTSPILVSTSVVPPYDPDLSVWERNPNRVQVTLTNTSATESFNVRVAGFAEGLDNGVRIEIKNDFPSDPILLAPSATVTLNARQSNLFDPNAVRVTGADRDAIARTRQLPEGDYRICLRALDHSTLEPLSSEGSGCAQFGIKAGELPRPISPPCDEEIRASSPQFIIFQWTRPSLNVPVASLANLRFRFVLVPMPDGGSPQEALETASDPIFLEEENIGNTFYQLGPADPWLEVGKSYAWRVQVSDPEGTQFENNGWSESCSFTYGSVDEEDEEEDEGEEEEEMEVEGCDPPLISVQFPNNRNSAVPVPRVPYRYLPVVATYAPFCPNLKSFSFILNIRDNGTTAQSWSRSYTWETGLLDSLREKADDPLILDETLLTPTIESNASTFLLSAPSLSGMKPLRPGVPLQWQAHVTTVTPDDVERKTTKSGMVSVGLDAPIPEFPKDGARLKSDALRFEFTTSPRPADSLLRPMANALAAERSRGGTAPSIPVKEVWMLEVARTPFVNPATTEVLYSHFGTVSSTLALSGKSSKGTTISPAVLQDIYKQISVTSGLATEQDEQYYWRVKWLVDNQIEGPRSLTPNDTAAYEWSPVSQFTIDESATDGDDCLRITGRVPTNTGLWQESLKPQFAVQIEPSIDSTKITGAQLQIWNLKTDGEKSRPTSVTSRAPDFEQDATGTITSGTFLSPVTDSTTRQTLYEVRFVNHPGSVKDFVGVDSGEYAWRLILRYDGATIRHDGVACPVNETVSSLATFRIDATLPDVSPEECIILTPTSPEFGSKIREAQPTFAIEATPPINPNGIDSVTIEIWKMKRATEKPVDVVKRTPVFRKILAKNSPNETRLDVNRHLQAILDSGTIKTPIGLTFVNGKNPVASFTAEYDTNYLWQVSMTVDPQTIRLDGVECYSTQISSAYGTFRRDTSSSNSNCPDSCSIAPPKAPVRSADTVPTFGANQTIKIGRFTLTLESVAEGSTADNLSGEGVVNIPFMRKLNVAVEFTGLRVNAQREVYSGVVNVQRAGDLEALPAEAGDALGMNNDEIRLAYAAATDGTRLLSNYVTGEGMQLPIGFDNDVDGERMTIGIVDMVFKPTGAYLAAVFSYPLPQLGPDVGIGLGARNICFSPTGMGGDSRRELYLAADLEFRQEDSWGFRVKAPTSEGGFVSDSGTYVAWDCNGFQAMRLRADVFFPRTWMLPITPEGEVDPDPAALVTGSFATTVRKGAHWLASATLSPFAPASMPDLHFAVESMVIDQSDLENDPSLVFPPEYKGDMTTAWRGFALKSGSVRLPEALSTFDTGEPPAISVNGMMIDRSGITGTLSVANLIPYPQGNFAGWAGGIDTVSIRFVSNSFAEGSFAGKIGLPITKEGVGYSASFAYSQQTKTPTFTLNLKPQDTLTVPLWVADLKLNSTATITLTKEFPDSIKADSAKPPSSTVASTSRGPKKKWVISATLTGDINVAGDAGVVPGLSISGLHFEGVGVKSVAPYLLPGTWSLAGFTLGEGTVEDLPPDTARGGGPTAATSPTTGDPAPQPGVAGFPLSITDIGPIAKIEDGKSLVGIEFKVVLNLMGGTPESPTGFSGATGIRLWGELKSDGGQKFEFSHASLASIAIDANFGPTAHVKGTVDFYEKDDVYGTGFYGALEVNVLEKFTAKSIVQIGSVKQNNENMRYWFVDMQAMFNPGVAIGSSGMMFYGAGGGLWHRMRRTGADPQYLPTSANLEAVKVGTSLSGYKYEPSQDAGLGFRIVVTLGAPNAATFNSDLAVMAQFTESGGLGEVGLEGQGYMMAGLHERENSRVRMNAKLTYSVPSEAFSGFFAMAVEQPPYSASGTVHIYVDPDTWHIKFGRPQDPVAVTFLSILSGKGYMMTGNNLPPRYMVDGVGDSAEGGIAFGASLGFSHSSKYGPFFGKIQASAGFNVSLVHFPNGCEGESSVGINGWYAMGDFYANLGVKVGIDVNLFVFKGRVTILELQLSAKLEGGFPRPIWMKGRFEAKYKALGGAVKGTCDFHFEYQKPCRPTREREENPFKDVPLVDHVEPANETFDADLSVSPRVAFTLPVEEVFHIPVMNEYGKDIIRAFKITMRMELLRWNKELESKWERALSAIPQSPPKTEEDVASWVFFDRDEAVYIGDYGPTSMPWLPVSGVVRMNDKTTATFYPFNMFESDSKYLLTIRASVSEFNLEKRTWFSSKTEAGLPIWEEHRTSFNTGVRPDKLTAGNVLMTVPADGQRFFPPGARNSCNEYGSIVVKRGVGYLLEPTADTSERIWVRITSLADRTVTNSDMVYRNSGNNNPQHIDFRLPPLSPGTIYRVELVRRERNRRGGFSWLIHPYLEETLYTYHFATSRYPTFRERIESLKLTPVKGQIASRPDVQASDAIHAREAVEIYRASQQHQRSNSVRVLKQAETLWINALVDASVFIANRAEIEKLSGVLGLMKQDLDDLFVLSERVQDTIEIVRSDFTLSETVALSKIRDLEYRMELLSDSIDLVKEEIDAAVFDMGVLWLDAYDDPRTDLSDYSDLETALVALRDALAAMKRIDSDIDEQMGIVRQYSNLYYPIAFENDEGFDVFDIEGYSIDFQGNTESVPLVQIGAGTASAWNRDFVEGKLKRLWNSVRFRLVTWEGYYRYTSDYYTKPAVMVVPGASLPPLTPFEIAIGSTHVFGGALVRSRPLVMLHAQGAHAYTDYMHMMRAVDSVRVVNVAVWRSIVQSFSLSKGQYGWSDIGFEFPNANEVYKILFRGYDWWCGYSDEVTERSFILRD